MQLVTNKIFDHNIHSSGHFDKSLSALEDEFQRAVPIGGGVLDSSFKFDEINPFIVSLCTSDLKTQSFKYVDHLKQCEAVVKYTIQINHCFVKYLFRIWGLSYLFINSMLLRDNITYLFLLVQVKVISCNI